VEISAVGNDNTRSRDRSSFKSALHPTASISVDTATRYFSRKHKMVAVIEPYVLNHAF